MLPELAEGPVERFLSGSRACRGTLKDVEEPVEGQESSHTYFMGARKTEAIIENLWD